MTSDDAEGGAGQSENKAAEKEKSAAMPPNEATPATAPSAPAAATGANGKDAPNEAVNADVEAGKLYEQDGVGGKVEFTANKAEDGEGNKNLYPAMTKAELMPYAKDPFWVRLRWTLFMLFWLAWLAMLVVSVVIIVLAPKCYRPAPKEWWQKGPVYQVYPKSFKDSNGDGKGDIKGIVEKLDYLSDLGIGSVWVSPMYPSPQHDNGYDVKDFKDIDPIFGDLNDFDELVAGLHERGLKLFMDFIPNHSSDQHEWFQKSVKKEEPYTNYYVWKKEKPNNWKSVFGDESAWTYHSVRGEYYLHQFYKEQPDLNVRNPAVVEELKKVLKFWLDRGVDGFRMDAVAHLFEDEGFADETVVPGGKGYNAVDHSKTYDLPEVLDLLRTFREVLDEKTAEDPYNPRIMMTEAYLPTDELMKYYGTNFTEHAGDISHMPANFALIEDLPDAESVTAENLDKVIGDYISSMPDNGAWPNFVLGNHDKSRVATRLGHDLVDVMHMVTMLLKGTPITYNGEEIGMEDGVGVRSYRDISRNPMQWDASKNAGFSSGEPWLPVNKGYEQVNVGVQLESKHDSHIKIYKALAMLRQQPSILYGTMDAMVTNGTVFAYSRVKKGNPGYVIIVNLHDEAVTGIDISGLPMVPEKGLVEVRSHHDRDDKAKEVELEDDEEAVGKELNFKNFTMRAKEGIVANFVPTKTP